MFVLIQIILLVYSNMVSSARIFGIGYVPSFSHHQVYLPVFKELSLRGHEVVLVTPNPMRDAALTNLTEIDVSSLYKFNSVVRNLDANHYFSAVSSLNDICFAVIEHILKNKEFQKLYINSSEKFDVIVGENHSPLLYALSHVFKAPIVALTSSEVLLSVHMDMGNPIHPALYTETFSFSFVNMTIWKKIISIYYVLWNKWYYNYVVLPKNAALAKKYFGDDLPALDELSKNVSVHLFSSIHFYNQYRPWAANFIPMDFVHVKPAKALPADLQEIMDNATNGIVYMSLGSNVKSTSLTPHFLNLIIKVFSDLPYTVFWKWEADDMSSFSKNIITRKWFPQQDLLAHPNVKVFVTQGGIQSIEEAVSRGVPMVGIPFITDQNMNVERMAFIGIGEKVDWQTATTSQLKNAIIKVAEDKRYKEKVEEVRNVAFDQPMTGLEKAIWWTEYVIRHKGARHLRSVIADTPLWEYLMLDVIAFLLGSFIAAVFVLYKLTGFLSKTIKHFSSNKVKTT